MKQVKISEIIADLNAGYVRYKRQESANYAGSIQEKYGLSDADMSLLCQHEKIKGIRTKQVPTLSIIDDTSTENKTEALAIVDDLVTSDIKIKPTVEPVL